MINKTGAYLKEEEKESLENNNVRKRVKCRDGVLEVVGHVWGKDILLSQVARCWE